MKMLKGRNLPLKYIDWKTWTNAIDNDEFIVSFHFLKIVFTNYASKTQILSNGLWKWICYT